MKYAVGLLLILPIVFLIGVALVRFVARTIEHPEDRRTDESRRLLAVVGWSMTAVGMLSIASAVVGVLVDANQPGPPAWEILPVVILLTSFGVILMCVAQLQLRLAKVLQRELSQRNQKSLDRHLAGLRVLGWMLIVFPGLLGVIVLAAIAVRVVFALALPVLFLPVTIYMIAVNNHRARQANLMWYLAIAVEKQMPLPEEVENYASGLRGSSRERVRDLAEMLRDGIPLSTALGHQRGLVPAFAVLAVHTGEETGTLPLTLRDAAVRFTSQMQRAATAPSAAWFFIYYWAIATFTMFMLSFLMYYIVPTFKKIFWDFGTELPHSTNALIAASDFATSYFVLIAPILWLPTIALIVAGIGYARGWGNLNPRWFTRRFPRFDSPSILRSLAMIVRAEQSVLDGLESLARQHHRTAIRARLEIVAEAVGAGDDCWQALHQQKFIDEYEYAVLESAQQVGNLPWALRELADSIERRREFRLMFWFEILRPIVVLIIGLTVAFVCIGFFMPLVKLIDDLS